MKSKGHYDVRELQVTFKATRKSANAIPLEFINQPADVADAFRFLTESPKEHFAALLLDKNNRVIEGYESVSIGVEDSSPFKPTCAFRAALLLGATRVIFVHNHPSGDPTPSRQDHAVFHRACQAGNVLGIEVLDFIVLGRHAFTSFTGLGKHTLRELVGA